MESKIEYYEKSSPNFKLMEHYRSRIQEMEEKSSYGEKVASKWSEILYKFLTKENYPVNHPIGQETFSLYAEYPAGVFEYALDIDGAAELIKEKDIKPVKFSPARIIDSVDKGNINQDLERIKPNHKNPVMVLKSNYLTDNRPYCINGNHRIFEAYRNDNKQIEVFVFNELEFIPFFYDALSKATYFFEIDYYNVLNDKRYFIDNEESAFADKL